MIMFQRHFIVLNCCLQIVTIYEIKNGNVYDQCFKDKHLFDFRGYPKDSVYYDSSNKKCLEK